MNGTNLISANYHSTYAFTRNVCNRDFYEAVLNWDSLLDAAKSQPKSAAEVAMKWKRDEIVLRQQALVCTTQEFDDEFSSKFYKLYEDDQMACIWNYHDFVSIVDEKNAYHGIVKLYQEKAFEMVRGRDLLGEAYACAMQEELYTFGKLMGDTSPNSILPNATHVFSVLRKKLWRLERMGFIWSKEIHMTFMEDAKMAKG